MGLFANRPEEPTEWAGLPSEPLDPQDETRLPDAPDVDLLGVGTGVGTGESLTSVSIDMPEPPDDSPNQ